MKNHFGVVVGVSMLAVAGLVVSQLPADSSVLTGQLVSSGQFSSAASFNSSTSFSSSFQSSQMTCEDKRVNGGVVPGSVFCSDFESKAMDKLVNAANAFCAGYNDYKSFPDECDAGCVQTGLESLPVGGFENNVICNARMPECSGSHGCKILAGQCALVRHCGGPNTAPSFSGKTSGGKSTGRTK